MTQLQRPGQVEGWQQDPYGRHELRFFDGQKWTPYVRDGEESGFDEPEPDGIPVRNRSRGGLLAEEVLVVQRHVDMFQRWSDRTIHRKDGTLAATMARAGHGTRQGAFGATDLRAHARSDVVEVVDSLGKVPITLIRPFEAPVGTTLVVDRDGQHVGRIVQESFRDTTFYTLRATNNGFQGSLRAENWVAWDLWIEDNRQRRVASITRDWVGLERSLFTTDDEYVVRITHPVPEPFRTLLFAAALSLEVAVRPDARGL